MVKEVWKTVSSRCLPLSAGVTSLPVSFLILPCIVTTQRTPGGAVTCSWSLCAQVHTHLSLLTQECWDQQYTWTWMDRVHCPLTHSLAHLRWLPQFLHHPRASSWLTPGWLQIPSQFWLVDFIWITKAKPTLLFWEGRACMRSDSLGEVRVCGFVLSSSLSGLWVPAPSPYNGLALRLQSRENQAKLGSTDNQGKMMLLRTIPFSTWTLRGGKGTVGRIFFSKRRLFYSLLSSAIGKGKHLHELSQNTGISEAPTGDWALGHVSEAIHKPLDTQCCSGRNFKPARLITQLLGTKKQTVQHKT